MKTLILIFAVFVAGGVFIAHAADDAAASRSAAPCAACSTPVSPAD